MGLTINSSASAVSSLFSNMGGNNSSNLGALTNTIAGLTTDYASIRNGSYNKVVKAYYKKGDSEDAVTVKKKTDKKTNEQTLQLAEAIKAKRIVDIQNHRFLIFYRLQKYLLSSPINSTNRVSCVQIAC